MSSIVLSTTDSIEILPLKISTVGSICIRSYPAIIAASKDFLTHCMDLLRSHFSIDCMSLTQGPPWSTHNIIGPP